jgi:hypothetical protein
MKANTLDVAIRHCHGFNARPPNTLACSSPLTTGIQANISPLVVALPAHVDVPIDVLIAHAAIPTS